MKLGNEVTSETGFKPIFVIRRPILKTKRIYITNEDDDGDIMTITCKFKLVSNQA